MTAQTAHVDVLTAEVRVLMVGSRQVTLSVYAQLDSVDPHQISAFGRVAPRGAAEDFIFVVGASTRLADRGTLVRSSVRLVWPTDEDFAANAEPDQRGGTGQFFWHQPRGGYRLLPVVWRDLRAVSEDWSALPLIVLAGLR